MNDENLIPLNKREPERRREIARLGGLKSGEKRRARKELRERLIERLRQYDICDCVVISHVMKKKYCSTCKYKQRANNERNRGKNSFLKKDIS